jgi:tetratricopeptide (TPR) repeat protein
MLRLIVWTAAIWFVLVFFTGCSQIWGTSPDKNGQWVKADQDQMANAPKAKDPPITATTYYTAGLLLENQGNLNGAVAKYARAIELDRRYTSAYNHLGICYIRLRTYDAAEEILKQALQHSPDLAYLHNNLGFCYLLQQKYLSAEAELKNALIADPKFRKAHANLGVALAKQGKPKEALDHFLQSCSEPEAYYNVGMILHSQGKLDQAEKYYRQSLTLSPKFDLAGKGLAQIKQDRESTGLKISLGQ